MAQYRTIYPKEVPTKDLHQYLLGTVAPRPIAFVSTLDEEGRPNLAPYSFFNAFSSNPPIVVFSSNRRVSNNTTKDTLANIMATKEAVINVVNYAIVRQMSLASVEYASGISEFEKSGLTPIPSSLVKPYRVAESPASMEVRVKDIITLGDHGGAGHLIICEVVVMHISEEVLDGDRIDPDKIDLMGRMGRAYYVRASGAAIHTIYQDILNEPIGYDKLPEYIRKSDFLSGNDIASLASCANLPSEADLLSIYEKEKSWDQKSVHNKAKQLIAQDQTEEALLLLMACNK